MKKLLAAFTVAACLCFASSALAAGVKVPKLLCLQWPGWYQQLAIKAVGTGYINGQKGKIYAINGTDLFGRSLTGTAYVAPESTILYGSYDTNYIYSTAYATGGYDLSLNLETGNGTVYWGYNGPEITQHGNSDVSIMDCATLSMISGDAGSVTPGIDASAGVR